MYRIGPFVGYYKKQFKKLGGALFVNPDGILAITKMIRRNKGI